MTTLIDQATGEIIEPCSPDRARDLTDKIKTSLGVAWELIKEAYTGRAWAALGYESWDDYCSTEFGTNRLRLPREERREVVGSLREAGLSVRAIAAATGNNKETVSRDLQVSGNRTPEPEWQADDPEPVEPSPVTGIDGKTYPAAPPRPAAPPKPQRRALTDSFFDAVFDLNKHIERIERLAEDDRFPRNAEQVAAKHRNDLLQAAEALSKVLDRLPIT